MSENQPTDSLWTDIEPNTLINEPKVPAKANDLTKQVDEWLSDFTEYVDPLNWQNLDEQFERKRAFAELSSYLLNAKGVAGDRPLPEIHDLILNRVNGRLFPHLLSRSPRELHHFVMPFIYTEYVSEVDEDTAKRLENVIHSGDFWGAERVPYRQMEYCFIFNYLSQLFGYQNCIYDQRDALENSILNHQPNIVMCLLPDAYCITHNALFYNDYLGVFPELFPEEPSPYDISSLLRGLILRYMAADNADIVLELVCAGVLEREISRQMVQLAMSWVCEKVDVHGFVPGPAPNKSSLMKSLDVDEDSLDVNRQKKEPNYDSKQEALWNENFHTNIVAGMTARIIYRDWAEIERRQIDLDFEVEAERRDITRIGQVLDSLSNYDLQKGAIQLKELSNSKVITEYEIICHDAADFLRNQETEDGNFGFWPKEEILYTNAGNSRKKFQSELIEPVSDTCREALLKFDSVMQAGTYK